MTERMLLSPEAITWIGSAFSEKTKISPFTTVQVPGFSETGKSALIEQGIIDRESAVTPESYAMFEVLAGAEAYAGFRLSGAFGNIDKTSYFKGDKVVRIDSAGQGLVISTKTEAVNFLIIENVLHVRCGQETNNQIITGEAIFLQAGLHDVLMLDVDAETVEFNSVSTHTMLEYLQSMVLKVPEFR